MLEKMTIKGLAVSMFGSVSGLGRSLNWGHSKVSRVINHPETASVQEVRDLCAALQLTDTETIWRLFFT